MDAANLRNLRLVYYPDPVLKRRAVDVEEFGESLAGIVRRMFEVMYANRGVGLAAPQVGLSIRLFVANPTGQPTDEKVYINPALIEMHGSAVNEEGCLSLPGIYGPINRAERCTIEACDLHGNRFVDRADGLLARIWQHETDHLDGVLIIDRMGQAARIAIRKALRELEASYRHTARG